VCGVHGEERTRDRTGDDRKQLERLSPGSGDTVAGGRKREAGRQIAARVSHLCHGSKTADWPQLGGSQTVVTSQGNL